MSEGRRKYHLALLRFGVANIVVGFTPYIASFFDRNHGVESIDQSIVPISPVIGIHLGQSFSQVGVIRDDVFKIIVDEQGRSDIPSYVAFLDANEPLVGFEAKSQALKNSQSTIYDITRLIGRNFSSPEVKDAIKELPYTIVDHVDQPLIMIPTKGENLAKKPQEISAVILAKLKSMAEIHLNTTVRNTVITVPSVFIEYQIQAMKEAAELARLNVVRIINETTSIGIAYHLGTRPCYRKRKYDCKCFLYHIGEKETKIGLWT